MTFIDITVEFREVVHGWDRQTPNAKHQKLSSKSSQSDMRREGLSISKQFLNEAYTILNHVNTLTRMLLNIRKPYLNVDSRSTPLRRQHSRKFDLGNDDSSWSGVKHLTNEERDQIDLQARVILTRCAERVKELEAVETKRAEIVASSVNPLSRLLPARLRQDTSTLSSDFLAAHHSGVIWYLSRRLAEASQTQKEMQEERVKRHLERTRTLGSGAAHEALHIGEQSKTMGPKESQSKSTSSWIGDASSSIIAAAVGVPKASNFRSTGPPYTEIPPPSDDDDDEELELSASQIIQFESENSHILQSVQDNLESVQQAESRLMDISALQMELINHLTKQTELTDQLYEDAITTVSTVEQGNKQLKEAKKRAKDSRLFILVFLVGASLSLLFLHYY